MGGDIEHIRTTYYNGLKQYLYSQNEKWLSKAYDQSQAALQAGISELDIINLHHEILPKIINENACPEFEPAIDRASTYLIEWMVAYDVKVRSYRRLIKQVKEKNAELTREIDQKEKAQQEVKEKEEYFRSLIENAQDIIAVLDEEGNVLYDTPSVYRILGYNQRELVGKNAFDFICEDDVKKVEHAFFDVIKDPGNVVSVEFRFQHKNGKWVYLESIAKRVSDNSGDTAIIVNSRDVTKQHERMHKLEEQRIKLAEAQKIAKVGSWEWNINDEPELEWSDELYRIFGLKADGFDHTYDTYISHVHPDDRDRVEEEIGKAYRNRSSFAFQHRIMRSDKEVRHVSCRGRLITKENGEPLKMLGTIQDISEQKEKEHQLWVYSEKLRELSKRVEKTREEERTRIAREIHDELGQMLTVLKIDMSLFNENIKNKIPDQAASLDSEMQEMMGRINTIIESVQRITTELRPEVLDDLGLIEAIEWQAEKLAKKIGLSVNTKSLLNDPDSITEDQKTTLFRIFQEAMSNIIRHAEATNVDVNLQNSNDNLLLTIEDNGKGITQEEKEARSSFGVIGMRERARFLGGDVNIEGEQGKGTLVTVKIPLHSNKDIKYRGVKYD